jgi:hypothetical protein
VNAINQGTDNNFDWFAELSYVSDLRSYHTPITDMPGAQLSLRAKAIL